MVRLRCIQLVALLAALGAPQRAFSFGSLEELYKVARQQRILRGHAAAQPLYAEILRRNPSDMTVSTRLAASNGTLSESVQNACSVEIDPGRVTHLRQWFQDSNFTSSGVHEVLQIQTTNACAPIYITPAASGQVEEFPFSNPDAACVLTALFSNSLKALISFTLVFSGMMTSST